MKSVEKSLIDFVKGNNFYDIIKTIEDANILEELPEINHNISEDFYKTNYVKILDYFNKETKIFDFYSRISAMNLLLDIMEKIVTRQNITKKFEACKTFTLSYCGHLQYALETEKNISI